MAVDKLKRFVSSYKELIMFFVGFGVMHYGWYNLQRSDTLNKALAANREKEIAKEYKRLEREINERWPLQQQNQSQKSGVILSAATEFAEKTSNVQ